MNDRPDDRTQPISTSPTGEQPAVPASEAADAAAPVAAAPTPSWVSAVHEGDASASARPVPVPGAQVSPGPYGPTPVASVAAAKPGWRSRVDSGRGLAVAALMVGLGLGAVGGAAVTYAATDSDRGGSIADGTGGFDRDGSGRFDRDGDDDFGPGRHGGPPPGGQLPGGQLPGGDSPQDGGGTGSGTGATGTDEAT